jgi:hypothetical protein
MQLIIVAIAPSHVVAEAAFPHMIHHLWYHGEIHFLLIRLHPALWQCWGASPPELGESGGMLPWCGFVQASLVCCILCRATPWSQAVCPLAILLGTCAHVTAALSLRHGKSLQVGSSPARSMRTTLKDKSSFVRAE